MSAVVVGGTAILAALGAAVGSFLNVVIWRVPRGHSVVRPASACPGCGARIRPLDNIPVLSWLLLRGRCRSCRATISPRYPAVELATLAAFVAIALTVLPRLDAATGVEVPARILELATLLALAALSLALAVIDLELHRLPNPLVGAFAGVALLGLGAAAVASGEPMVMVRMLIAGAAAFAVFLLVAFVRPDGMGFGDVKLAGAMGIALGWWGWGSVVVGFFAAFLLGGIVGIVLVLARRVSRGGGIPFGPWLLVGTWIGIVAGELIAQLYLAFVGLA